MAKGYAELGLTAPTLSSIPTFLPTSTSLYLPKDVFSNSRRPMSTGATLQNTFIPFHFLPDLCPQTVPIQLLHILLPQATITLNLMWPSCVNLHLSAHAFLHGPFDYSRTPMAHPSTKVHFREKNESIEHTGPPWGAPVLLFVNQGHGGTADSSDGTGDGN